MNIPETVKLQAEALFDEIETHGIVRDRIETVLRMVLADAVSLRKLPPLKERDSAKMASIACLERHWLSSGDDATLEALLDIAKTGARK